MHELGTFDNTYVLFWLQVCCRGGRSQIFRLLVQNFWIRVRNFFKFENPTPVHIPATIGATEIQCLHLSNDFYKDHRLLLRPRIKSYFGPVFFTNFWFRVPAPIKTQKPAGVDSGSVTTSGLSATVSMPKQAWVRTSRDLLSQNDSTMIMKTGILFALPFTKNVTILMLLGSMRGCWCNYFVYVNRTGIRMFMEGTSDFLLKRLFLKLFVFLSESLYFGTTETTRNENYFCVNKTFSDRNKSFVMS